MVITVKTELIHIDNIPSEQELVFLLGENIHKYHNNICAVIISLLSPDVEIWDHAGRRGKYLHGYRIKKRSILVNLYLYFVNGQGSIACEFHFIKKYFLKVIKNKDLFSEQMQKSIDSCIRLNEEYGGGYYLDTIIRDEETLQDAIQIIQIVGNG